MIKINSLIVYKILDSHGYWGLAGQLNLNNNQTVEASLPLAETESVADSLKSADQALKQLSKLVLPAVGELEVEGDFVLAVDELLSKLLQQHKSLSPQACLLISLLSARAGALVKQWPLYKYLHESYQLPGINYSLPTPIFNMFNGGLSADTNLDFAELLLMPLSKNKTDINEKLNNASLIWHQLAEILRAAGLDTDIGGQGGYAPDMSSTIQALDFIMEAITAAGFQPGQDFALGLNIGSHHLYNPEDGHYLFRLDHSRLTAATLLQLYREWLAKYPIVYLQDAVNDDDLTGWRNLTDYFCSRLLIAGDSFFANNIKRLRQVLKEHLANSLVVKIASAGCLQEIIEFVKLAQKHNYQIIAGAVDRETADSFLADLAVAINADFIKAGSLSRSERTAKYNRLLAIAQTLNN